MEVENLTPATIAKAWYCTSFVLQLIVFQRCIVKKEKVTFLSFSFKWSEICCENILSFLFIYLINVF